MEGKNQVANRSELYAGLVWILSAVVLFIYGILLSFGFNIPGVEELISFLLDMEEGYIYLAAFVFIFIEGLYVIGNFFPGASLVIFIAIISQSSSPLIFLVTITFIFIGWCLAGAVNILVAHYYRSRVIKLIGKENYDIKNKAWGTWFPSFRSSHEVAQVIEGGNPLKVFVSSLKVRVWTSLLVGGIAFVTPFFFNIEEITNREGYISLIIVAAISLVVGLLKIKTFYSRK